jgi:hypothetical protein
MEEMQRLEGRAYAEFGEAGFLIVAETLVIPVDGDPEKAPALEGVFDGVCEADTRIEELSSPSS